MSVDYVKYYMNQAGNGSTDYFRGTFSQAGSGLRQRGQRYGRMGGGSWWSNFTSGIRSAYDFVAPYAQKVVDWILPPAKQMTRAAGDIGLETLSGVAKDYLKGRPLAESVNNAIPTAINDLKRAGAQTVVNTVDQIKKARDLGASVPDMANINTTGEGLRQRGRRRKQNTKRLKKNFILFKKKKHQSHKNKDIFGEL